jgi:chromosome segregation ATPase
MNQCILLANLVLDNLKLNPNYYSVMEEALEETQGEINKDEDNIETGIETKDTSNPEDTEVMGESIKVDLKIRINEAIAKAEQETIIELAEAQINELQDKYITDIVNGTKALKEQNEDLKCLKANNVDLSKKLSEGQEKEKNLSSVLALKEKEIKTLENKLKELSETKSDEITSLREQIEEAKVTFAYKLRETRVKATVDSTGLKLTERDIKDLLECKSDAELTEKIEVKRDEIARSLRHTKVVEKVTITENARPVGKVDGKWDTVLNKVLNHIG